MPIMPGRTGLEEKLVLGAERNKIVLEKRVGIRGKEAEVEIFGEETTSEEKSVDRRHAAVNGRDWL